MANDKHSVSINRSEHIGTDTTGDNINAKRVANYVWNSGTGEWERQSAAGGGGGGTQYTEDSAHTTGDTGTMSLAVRNDAGTSLVDTDGDYSPLSVDSSGRLRTVVSGAGSGGTSSTDDSAFTVGTDAGTGAMGIYQSVEDSVDDGDIGVLAMTADRHLKVEHQGEVAINDGGNTITVDGTVSTDQVQYTEGATDATITGNAIMFEDAADTLEPVSATKPLPSLSYGTQPDGDLVSDKADGEFFRNTTPLGIGGVFTSSWYDTDGFRSLSIIVIADQQSATDGLEIEYTDDVQGTPTAKATDTYTFNGSDVTKGYKRITIPPTLDGFRVVYTNGSTAQSTFEISVTGRVNVTEDMRTSLDDNVSDSTVAATRRAILAAKKPNGAYTNIDATAGGNLKVSVEEFDGAVFGQTTMSASLPVAIASDQTDISIDDGGNSITVDGTVTANLSATDNAVLDTIETNTDFGTVVGGGAEASALRVTLANDSTGLLSVDDGGGSLTVDGTVTANAGTGNFNVNLQDGSGTDITSTGGALDVNVASGAAAGTEYTEGDTDATITGRAVLMEGATDTLVPLQGTAADGLLVNLGSNNDVSVTGTVTVDASGTAVPVTDNGGSLTVDGTVAATQSGTWNINNVSGTVSLPTGAATSALQTTGNSSLSTIATNTAVRGSSSSVTSVAGSATSVQLLAASSSRKEATITNDSTADLYVKLGTTASTTSYTVKLRQDESYIVDKYTGRIDGIWSSATGNARITQVT